MSKLLTDSETLMRWIEPGACPDDYDLYYRIKALKQSIVNIAMLQIYVEGEQLEQLRYVNQSIVAVLGDLLEIQKDFSDVIDAKFKK